MVGADDDDIHAVTPDDRVDDLVVLAQSRQLSRQVAGLPFVLRLLAADASDLRDAILDMCQFVRRVRRDHPDVIALDTTRELLAAAKLCQSLRSSLMTGTSPGLGSERIPPRRGTGGT